MVWIFGWYLFRRDFGLEGLLNSYSLGQMTKEQVNLMANKLEGMNTDWFKILFRNAYTQTHNLSISGELRERIIIFL